MNGPFLTHPLELRIIDLLVQIWAICVVASKPATGDHIHNSTTVVSDILFRTLARSQQHFREIRTAPRPFLASQRCGNFLV